MKQVIWVFGESATGKKTFIEHLLKQNDIVYVEPNDAKKRNYRYSQAQQYNVTFFSTILSAISVITSMVVTLVSLKK